MQDLVRLALLAARMVAPPAAPPCRPAWVGIAGFALAAVFGCLALGFTMAALWLFLWPWLGGGGTALVLAGLTLATAAGLALWLRQAPAKAAAPAPPAVSLEAAEQLIRAHLAPSLLAALMAGAYFGSNRSPRS